MIERQPGWYWVRLAGSFDDGCGEWIPSQLNRYGEPDVFEKHLTAEIGPRIPTPDEPWQTVPVEATEVMVEATDGMDVNWGYESDGRLWSPEHCWRIMLAAAPKPGGE